MKYEVIPEACRICLKKSRSCRSIFKPYHGEDMAPFEKLRLVAGVSVIEDDKDFPGLPQLICKSCEISLNMAFCLRNTARKSDQVIHIYCNNLIKDNIIVELNTGRKFKLSKELTLKVVRKNEAKNPVASKMKRDVLQMKKIGPSYEESQKADPNLGEIEKNETQYEEDYRDVDTQDLVDEDHFNSSDEDDNHEVDHSKPTCTIEEKSVEDCTKQQQCNTEQTYNATEIAKQLEASDKYEVISWKQEDEQSVPIFKLRRKILDKSDTNCFICDVCGNIYHQRHRLMDHMKRHSDEKRYECEICNKRFAVSEGLRRHILTHGAHRPFKCRYCTRTFYTQSARKAHEAIHNGAKPFVCKICGKAFAYSCSLHKHMLIHENKKLYRCDYCFKEFRLQHHLKQHEETQIHKSALEEHMKLEVAGLKCGEA